MRRSGWGWFGGRRARAVLALCAAATGVYLALNPPLLRRALPWMLAALVVGYLWMGCFIAAREARRRGLRLWLGRGLLAVCHPLGLVVFLVGMGPGASPGARPFEQPSYGLAGLGILLMALAVWAGRRGFRPRDLFERSPAGGGVAPGPDGTASG